MRRLVRRSPGFLTEAMQRFPPGGSVGGRPSFEMFEQGPLKAAETAFSLGFETMTQPDPELPVRFVATAPTPVFTPLCIWGLLVTDGAVEIVGITDDPEYWDTIAGDPK